MVQSPSSSTSSESAALQLDRLHLRDVAPLLRLMGELACLRNDPRSWRLALLGMLNQLLPAVASAAFIIKNISPETPPIVVSIFDAGFKIEAHRQAFLREFNAAPFRDPFAKLLLTRMYESRLSAGVMTALRSDLVDDETWQSSSHVQEYRRPAHLGDYLLSVHPNSDRSHAMIIAAFKSRDDSLGFSPRDRMLVDTLHAGLDWMYRAEEATHRLNRASALSPRLRQTLEGLLAGNTERQVAIKMSLSVHTVHDYVKALYVHFGVSSRTELIARWVQTGGQVPPSAFPDT